MQTEVTGTPGQQRTELTQLAFPPNRGAAPEQAREPDAITM